MIYVYGNERDIHRFCTKKSLFLLDISRHEKVNKHQENLATVRSRRRGHLAVMISPRICMRATPKFPERLSWNMWKLQWLRWLPLRVSKIKNVCIIEAPRGKRTENHYFDFYIEFFTMHHYVSHRKNGYDFLLSSFVGIILSYTVP